MDERLARIQNDWGPDKPGVYEFLNSQPRPFPTTQLGAWIAATAFDLARPLVTHNPEDFGGIAGLEVDSAPSTR